MSQILNYRRLAAFGVIGLGAVTFLSQCQFGVNGMTDRQIHTVSSFSTKKGKTVKCSKTMVTRKMATGQFSTISLTGGMKVEYTPYASPMTVRLVAPDNLIDYIRLSVKKGCLSVEVERGYECDEKNAPRILISGEGLANFNLSAASAAYITAPFAVAGSMEVNLDGASLLEVRKGVTCERISLECDGASHISMENVAVNNMEMDIDGASGVKMNNVSVAANVEMEADGASTVKLTDLTASFLKARSDDASTITLTGTATNVTLEASGAGSIKAEDLKCLRASTQASGAGSITCNAESLTKISKSEASTITNMR
ncbi:MAG: DUF2807 domain-containing protein [Muribaculaceae bacterium]|nr:DUF2807 domain-containing protein [Muribaculaceae bacterium]